MNLRPILGAGAHVGPYNLSDGERLSLPHLSKLITDGKICEKRGGQLTLKFAIVSGSGRYCCPGSAQSLKQAGLVSDSLYIPEVVHSLDCLCLEQKPDKINPQLKSLLDIDVTARESDEAEIKRDYNLLLCGSGAVNSLTAHVIAEYNSRKTPLKVSFDSPNSQIICGLDSSKQPVEKFGMAHSNYGVLSLSANPWSDGDRIVLICAGMGASGTIAAIFALYQCITNPGCVTNNRHDKTVPAKIVRGNLSKYKEDMVWPTASMLPSFDVRNLCDSCPYDIIQ